MHRGEYKVYFKILHTELQRKKYNYTKAQKKKNLIMNEIKENLSMAIISYWKLVESMMLHYKFYYYTKGYFGETRKKNQLRNSLKRQIFC